MKPHEFLDDDARDQLAQHVLGTLPEPEARTLALHVAACAVCRREADELLSVVHALGALGPRREPDPGTWARIRERIRAKSGSGTPSPFSRVLDRGGEGNALRATLVRAAEASWTPTGVPGIELRRLHVDRANDRATILARMAPGASYPAHVHAGPEDCFVLEGDLWEGERKMSAGDYEHAPGGSRHEVQTTREGCLLLIVSSLGDRVT
jgi:anti-sigma factor ChrR (cupin superfamily)